MTIDKTNKLVDAIYSESVAEVRRLILSGSDIRVPLIKEPNGSCIF